MGTYQEIIMFVIPHYPFLGDRLTNTSLLETSSGVNFDYFITFLLGSCQKIIEITYHCCVE